MAGWGLRFSFSIPSLSLEDELGENDSPPADVITSSAARQPPAKSKSTALKETVEGTKRGLSSPKRERTPKQLTNDEINKRMGVVMKHSELWPKFKMKLAQSESQSSTSVRAVMIEFLIEHEDILNNDGKPSRRRTSIFDAFAGITAEFEEEAKTLVEQDILASKAKPPVPTTSTSRSSSRRRGRPTMEKGLSARRMMNGFQMEAQHSQRSLMSEGSARSTRSISGGRPSLMIKQLSSRAMNNLEGETEMKTESSIRSSRSIRPSLMVKQLSSRAMNNLEGETEMKTDSSVRSARSIRPSLMVKQLSNRAMNNLEGEASDAPTARSISSPRVMVKQLSSRAIKNLASEAGDELTSSSSHSNRSLRNGRPSMVKELSNRAMANLAGEATSEQRTSNADVPPPPPASASPSPVAEFARKLSLSPKIRQTIVGLSDETMSQKDIDASPVTSGRKSMKEERQDSLHSLDLNDPDPVEHVGELEASSMHSQRSKKPPGQTTSGGLDSLVGTIRRVSTIFGQDIQTEVEVDFNSSIGSGLTFQSDKVSGNNLYDSFASFTDEDIMDLHKSTTSIFSPIEENEEDEEDDGESDDENLVRRAAKIAAKRRNERDKKLDDVEEIGESSERTISSDDIPPKPPVYTSPQPDPEKLPEKQSDVARLPTDDSAGEISPPEETAEEESMKEAAKTEVPNQSDEDLL